MTTLLTFQLVIDQRHANNREFSRVIAGIATLFSAFRWPNPRFCVRRTMTINTMFMMIKTPGSHRTDKTDDTF